MRSQQDDDWIPIVDGGTRDQLLNQLAQVDRDARKRERFPLTLDFNQILVSSDVDDLMIPLNTLVMGINANFPQGEEWILTGAIVRDKLLGGFPWVGGNFIAAYNTTTQTGKLRCITQQIRFFDLLLWVTARNWESLRPY